MTTIVQTCITLLILTGINYTTLAQENEQTATQTKAETVDNAKGATIEGTTFWKKGEEFVGRERLRWGNDATCIQLNKGSIKGTEGSIVNHRTDYSVRNVIVYVSEGLPSTEYATPTTAVLLDQVGCMYVPHVLTCMVNQPVTIRNSDPTAHNVHAVPRINPVFNFGQTKKNMTKDVKLPRPEIFKVKCDVHPWMIAWIGVFDHPFHAVSDKSGKFKITGLPPGKYTITAWHEIYGSFSKKVVVSDQQINTINFVIDLSNQLPNQ